MEMQCMSRGLKREGEGFFLCAGGVDRSGQACLVLISSGPLPCLHAFARMHLLRTSTSESLLHSTSTHLLHLTLYLNTTGRW